MNLKQFRRIVADNLKQDKEYFYFLPADMPGDCRHHAERFINTLKDTGVSHEVLARNLKIRKVSSAEILCNITLLDPEYGEKEGFILPAYESAGSAFSIRLDDTLHDRAYNRVKAWCCEGGSEVIWPRADKKL